NGARYMADLADSLLLWEQVRPELVSDRDWQSVQDVYLRDRYDLGMARFFEEHNPAARDKLVHTMLDAIERGDWNADAETRAELEQLVKAAANRSASARPQESRGDGAARRRAVSALVQGAAPAPVPAPAPAPATASALPASSVQVSGYELVPSANQPKAPTP